MRDRNEIGLGLNAFLDNINDAIYVVDLQWRIKHMNRVAKAGCTFCEPLGKDIWRILAHRFSPLSYYELREALLGGGVTRLELSLWSNGGWQEVGVYPFNDGFILSCRDITERKKQEENWRLSADKYTKIFRFSPQLIAISTFREGRYIEVNESFSRITGYEPQEVLGRTAGELDIWVNLKARARILKQLLKEGEVNNIEIEFRKKTGELRIGSVSAGVIEIDNETCMILTLSDITDHRRAEEAVRLSENRFRKVFNSSQSMMRITSLGDSRYIDVNESWVHKIGYSREEVVGHTALELGLYVSPEEDELINRIVQEQGRVYNKEIEFYKKSGEKRIGLGSFDLIDINGDLCVLGVLTDITENRRLAKEIDRLERLKLVGEMAAGIAHEIRNPMTTVRGFLQMFSHREEFSGEQDNLELMINELDRANSIISDYLSLASDKMVNLENRNLNDILKHLKPLIMADAVMWDKNVRIETNPIPDLPLDQNEIIQVILNIFRNGLEATPPGGVVIIKTLQDRNEVVLSVMDQGKGIAPEIIDKIGVPFLTTKERGTGLGLAVCYGIALRHNARIDFSSSPSGTTFNLRFRLNNKE